MPTPTDTRAWLWAGAVQGIKYSIDLSLVYAFWLACMDKSKSQAALFTPFHTSLTTWVTDAIAASLTFQEIVLLIIEVLNSAISYAVFIFSIPALVIGLGSGLILGWLFSRRTVAPYPKVRRIVSSVWSITVVLIFNITVYLTFREDTVYNSYFNNPPVTWFFVRLPSLIYIGMCLWLSHQIPLAVERARAKATPIKPTPIPPI